MNKSNPRFDALCILLLKLAARPDGVGTSEISGHTVEYVGNCLHRMLKKGQVFRGKLGHRSVRFFSTQAAAESWEARSRPPTTRLSATASAMKLGTTRGGKAWWPADAPMNITENTIRTYAEPLGPPVRTNTYAD
mgnify:CR=1 FL=1